MTIFQAIFLGVIQGLTEFLPISSTAHLLLAQALFGWNIPKEEAFSFDILVQLGTLLSLIVFFWKDLGNMVKAMLFSLLRRQPASDHEARLGWQVLLATLPALAAGVLFKDLVEGLFSNPSAAAAIRLFVTAILLWFAEKISQHNRNLGHLTWRDALWIGSAQILSVFPGASRSGSTITGGMTRHLDRPAAARFAFLMSIPVMLAAGTYQSIDLVHINSLGAFMIPLLVGFCTAALVGYLAVRWLLSYLARHPLHIFAIYCLALGLFSLIYSIAR